MSDTKPTLEEQIASQVHLIKNHSGNGFEIDYAILASLKELAAIKSQPVPVEPDVWEVCGEKWVRKEGYDSLQSALQVAQQKRDTVSVPKLVCAICGADRYQEDCKGDKIKCPMAGVAAQEGKK